MHSYTYRVSLIIWELRDTLEVRRYYTNEITLLKRYFKMYDDT